MPSIYQLAGRRSLPLSRRRTSIRFTLFPPSGPLTRVKAKVNSKQAPFHNLSSTIFTTQNLAVRGTRCAGARGQRHRRMRTASPGGNDDIGAAGGPTEHDTRSAAWMTSLMVANWGSPSAPSQVIVPWDSRVLEGAREGRRLARPTRTPNKLSWWEMGSGSTRGRSPTWTLICKGSSARLSAQRAQQCLCSS